MTFCWTQWAKFKNYIPEKSPDLYLFSWKNQILFLTNIWQVYDKFLTNFWQFFDRYLNRFLRRFLDRFLHRFWQIFGKSYISVRFRIEVDLIWFSLVLWNYWISKWDFLIMDHSGARDMWLSQQWQPQGIPELLSTFASQLEIY